MNKLHLILFFVLNISLNAQNHRFIYEYKYVPDSTKVDSVLTENMRLTIFKDHSEFLSEMKAKSDSSNLKSSENNGDVSFSPGNIRNFIWKSYHDAKDYSLEYIGMESYKVYDERKLNWKLLNENKKIQNYNCQKATAKFGNREWTAWFTTDLPFQDGPNIFKNLPGLIIAIEDTKKHHSFQLVANYETNDNLHKVKSFSLLKTYEVNRKQFNKKWNEYRRNPIGNNEQFLLMNPQIKMISIQDEKGNTINLEELRKNERIQAKKNILRNNNFLDLELYR